MAVYMICVMLSDLIFLGLLLYINPILWMLVHVEEYPKMNYFGIPLHTRPISIRC